MNTYTEGTSGALKDVKAVTATESRSHQANVPDLRRMEAHEWSLWSSAIFITLILTLAIVSFLFPLWHSPLEALYSFDVKQAARGLLGAVLLFDLYALHQQLQMHRIRRHLVQRDELLRLISENIADMIALVDMNGNRLYNSPSYEKVLGYTPEELGATSSWEQIHPDDRHRVAEAAAEARRTGVGRMLEYRMRHRDGTWRTLESSASVICNSKGLPEKLVIVNRDISARKRAEDKLVYSAFHDSLTDLPNRALLLDRLEQTFSHAKRHPDYKFAVLFIDIDDFKMFNDSFGRAFGDELIVAVGSRLTECLRRDDTVARFAQGTAADDTVARLGGDEFAVLLNDIKDPSDAVRVANRIQQVFANPFIIDSQEVFASASIGIASSTKPHSSAEDLLRDADIAMYRAKALGKGHCEVFDPEMYARAVQRFKLESDLHRAVERQEFQVYYQPIVSLQNGRITGMEALVRWNHPELGLVLPDGFIAVAEETGLIVPISRWVLAEACRQTRLWNLQHGLNPPLTITANLSPRQFLEPDLVAYVTQVVREVGIDPYSLQVEITESVAMGDADLTRRILASLKELGVRLSIDDFGTGHSSLTRLGHFPVDTLKIDRSFIGNLESDSGNREIVRIIMMLGQHLGLKVIAEGVETAEHVNFLKDLRCEFAQGFFFSRPVPQEAIEPILVGRHAKVGAPGTTMDKDRAPVPS